VCCLPQSGEKKKELRENNGRAGAVFGGMLAGATLFKGIDDTSEEDWDRIINTNLKSIFLCCKAAIPAMRKSGGGSIVNIASVAGLIGMPEHFVYCAAKAGAIHLTKSLALDHGGENIRINCICPGGVRTPMLGEVINVNDPA
jgi:NAD(P)-dependent dehydrogenase (short-subunit alcohol dehydrogenase family)